MLWKNDPHRSPRSVKSTECFPTRSVKICCTAYDRTTVRSNCVSTNFRCAILVHGRKNKASSCIRQQAKPARDVLFPDPISFAESVFGKMTRTKLAPKKHPKVFFLKITLQKFAQSLAEQSGRFVSKRGLRCRLPPPFLAP